MSRPLAIAALVIIAACLQLTAARAARADTYSTASDGCTDTSQTNWGGGGTDANGTVYVPCDGTIMVTAANNAASKACLDENNSCMWATDVAPNPDGSILYAAVTPNSQNQGTQLVERFIRTATLTPQGAVEYAYDPAWNLQFSYGGVTHQVRSREIATDRWGDIYISNGLWQTDPGPNNTTTYQPIVILKFDPNGNLITQFGDHTPPANWTTTASSWGNGESVSNAGLAVSPDGKQVYFADMAMGRIQDFALQGNGSYAWARQWGNTQADYAAGGSCAAGKFAAPYDVGTDAWGYVYVMNTTCAQVQKFTATGGYVGSWSVDTLGGGEPVNQRPLSHGLAVTWRGDVYTSPPTNRLLRRTSADPGPMPSWAQPQIDTTGPTVTLSGPATSTIASVTLSIAASDPSGVSQMRAAGPGADINAAAWGPVVTTVGENLVPGPNTFTVEAQDSWGNVSAPQTFTVTYSPPAAAKGGPTTTKKTTTKTAVKLPLVPVLVRLRAPQLRRIGLIPLTVGAVGRAGVSRIRIGTAGGWSRWIAYATRINVSVPASSFRRVKIHGHVWYRALIRAQVRDRKGRQSAIRAINVLAA